VKLQSFLFTLRPEVSDKMVHLRKCLPYRAEYCQSQPVLFDLNLLKRWAGISRAVYQLATDWTVWRSNPSGGRDFRNRPDRPRGLHSLLDEGYRIIPGVKCPKRCVSHWPPSSAEVEERADLYLYFPSVRSWQVIA